MANLLLARGRERERATGGPCRAGCRTRTTGAPGPRRRSRSGGWRWRFRLRARLLELQYHRRTGALVLAPSSRPVAAGCPGVRLHVRPFGGISVPVLSGAGGPGLPARRSPAGPAHGHPSGRRERTIVRATLVVVELALSVVLLAGAGLDHQQPGSHANARPRIHAAGSRPGGRGRFHERGMQPLRQDWPFTRNCWPIFRQVPDVRSVGGASALPMSGAARMYALRDNDGPLRGGVWQATADYFATLEIPVIQGRTFTENARRGTALPLRSSTSRPVRPPWPDESPLGRGR